MTAPNKAPLELATIYEAAVPPELRRATGIHYTSEANILKLIAPLFLDDLRQEFQLVKTNARTGRVLSG